MMRVQVDVSEFTVENAIYRSFDGIVRQQLDPIWYRVSVRSKQLIGDIKTLRKLLTYARERVNAVSGVARECEKRNGVGGVARECEKKRRGWGGTRMREKRRG